MRFRVNGEDAATEDSPTVSSVIRSMGREPSAPGVAVAVNGEVVPRSEWATRTIGDGDEVEVLAAIGGG